MTSLPTFKRQHLPFNMSNGQKSITTDWTNLVCGSKLNRLFLLTCTVSLCLQIMGSMVSRNHFLPDNNELLTVVDPHHPESVDGSRRLAVDDTSLALQQQKWNGKDSRQQQPSDKKKSGADKNRPNKRLKVLFGILSADFFNDRTYRKRHRALFELWNDSRVCSLFVFMESSVKERERCEVIWTFVVGAGGKDAPPENVSNQRPMLVDRPAAGDSPDWNEPDMTLLNIRENMNEGKSQTWLKYASEVASQYDIDYVVKCDADTILHLHEFFQFAYSQLPPAPYNRGIYVGALRDKAYWPRHATEEERIRFESYFGNHYEGVHLYVAGA
jgi:hypothetical protein